MDIYVKRYVVLVFVRTPQCESQAEQTHSERVDIT